jgi:hypothetical protein
MQTFSTHKDDQIRLLHMLDAAREAMEFTKSRTRKSLYTDRMLVLSLVKEITCKANHGLGRTIGPFYQLWRKHFQLGLSSVLYAWHF